MAGKSVNKRELAKRYALALRNALAPSEQKQSLEALISFGKDLSESEYFAHLVSGELSLKQVRTIIAELSEKAGLHRNVKNFLLLLAENKRLIFLSEILETVQADLYKSENIVCATITVASPLSDEQKAQAYEAVQKLFSATPLITEVVDESILSGYIIQVGSKKIDNSLKTKIDKLHKTMKGVV